MEDFTRKLKTVDGRHQTGLYFVFIFYANRIDVEADISKPEHIWVNMSSFA